jgi:hypothetical protein
MPMESHEKAAEFHDSPHKRTVLVLRTTGKKITRPDSIIAKRVCLLVQHDAQKRSVDLKAAVVIDEAQFSELVHEEIDA